MEKKEGGNEKDRERERQRKRERERKKKRECVCAYDVMFMQKDVCVRDILL